MDSTWLIDGPAKPGLTVVLAHGAGAPMDTPFMDLTAKTLAEADLRVVRFEFPYMRRRRTEGKKPGPDRPPVLTKAWHDCVTSLDVPTHQVIIGGKSMGGRIATLCADTLGVAGVACLGYPFHPVGRPETLRVEHLLTLRTPCFIAQGDRDSMGTRTEVESYRLPASFDVHWLPDGDHSFKPRKASGHSFEQNVSRAATALASFARRIGG